MVYLTEAAMDRLKGKTPHAKSLEMTPEERSRAGQYFRIQIPIRDRGALKEQATLLRRVASVMDTCSSMWQQRDYQLISIVKGEVAFVNARARAHIYPDSENSDAPAPPDETQ